MADKALSELAPTILPTYTLLCLSFVSVAKYCKPLSTSGTLHLQLVASAMIFMWLNMPC